jgi:uncharacterized protein with HEPN domain
MNPLAEERINEVQALCRRFGVHRLDVFGSAATGSFDPATSDIDSIVDRAFLSMPPRSPQLLEDIRDAAAFIAEVTRGVTLERYAADRMLRQAVERNFEIIGEAVKRLSAADRSHRSALGIASRSLPCRNLLIHGYDLLDHGLVLTTAENQVPKLLTEVEALLAERG